MQVDLKPRTCVHRACSRAQAGRKAARPQGAGKPMVPRGSFGSRSNLDSDSSSCESLASRRLRGVSEALDLSRSRIPGMSACALEVHSKQEGHAAGAFCCVEGAQHGMYGA